MDERKVIYFEDELNDEFSTAVIEPRRIDESYVYRKDSAWKSFTHFFWYRIIATPIAFFYTKIAHGHKIVGKDRLRKFKRSGYFLYGNHEPVQSAFCFTSESALIRFSPDTPLI